MKRSWRVVALAVGALLALPVAAAGHPAPSRSFVPQWLMERPAAPAAKSFGSHKPKPSHRVEVLAHHNPGGFNADVVAHRDYAYLGSWGNMTPNGEFCPAQGVRVYDIDNVRRPRIVSTFADGVSNPMLEASWTEKVQVQRVSTRWFRGDLAAVSFQPCEPGGFNGIGLYDVSNPRHPRELGLLQNGVSGVHELWLQVRRNRAYVYQATIFEEVFQFFGGQEPGNPDFRVIDVSDPRNPQQVGSWGIWKEQGIVPTAARGSFPFNFVHSMIGNERGDRVYLSYWDIGTVILDMSDPTDPEFVGRTSFAANQEGNAHSSWLADREDILIENQEDSDPTFTPGIEDGYGYTRIFDISNERRPRELSTFKMPTQVAGPGPGDYTAHDPKVRGDKLFMSHYAEGVVVLDIDRPSRPKQIAQFVPTPSGDPFGFWFGGAVTPHVWGVWLHDDVVLASDINNGLWIFRLK
jgi:hypothetical protein